MAEHFTEDVLKSFLASDLPSAENRRVVRHLLSRCTGCLAVARQQMWDSLGLPGPDALTAATTVGAAELNAERLDRYDAAIDSVLTRLPGIERSFADERLQGLAQWSRLQIHPPAQRLLVVRNDSRCHTWGLMERLLGAGTELGRHDPAAAVDVALLAVEVSRHLDVDRYGREQVADMRAGALVALGNTRRLASDFSGAQKAFRHAHNWLRRGTGDPQEEGRLRTMEASLLRDLGRFEEAAASLETAIQIYREVGDHYLEGRTLIKLADSVGYLDAERGVELSRSALALPEIRKDPYLELCARHNLIWFMNDTGRPREAQVLLNLTRPLYRRFRDDWTKLRQAWLEARIAHQLGELEEAENLLIQLTERVVPKNLQHEATLLSIDLMEVYASRGKTAEGLTLARAFYEQLQSWGMHREGLAVWILAMKGLVEQSSRSLAFRELSGYYRRWWWKPADFP
jgi:tetratricopeptide (TPR) repeat protein